MPAITLDDLYFGALDDRAAVARRLYREHGPRLAAEVLGAARLARLDALAASLQQRMRDLDLDARCARCGADDGGCCSERMAGEADAALLLLNLLLGAGFEVHRPATDVCRYLGARGCTLRLKPFICINFVCPWLVEECSEAELAALRRDTGELLQEVVACDEEIRAALVGGGW